MESKQTINERIQRVRPVSDSAQPETESCPICRATGWAYVEGKGVKPCSCRAVTTSDRRLIEARVPPRYRPFRLATLTPDLKRSPKQAEAIAGLRSDPWREKIFIHGAKKGAGKSLLGWCVMVNALDAGLPAYGIETDLLLQELHQATVNQNAPRPYLLPKDLMVERRYSDKPAGCLLLDEAEKANFTEFNSRQLFQILQQAVNWCWQIVIISNVDADQLQTVWQQAGNNIGEAIARRALEDHFPISL